MSAALDIWLYGEFIGRLSSQRTDHLRFDPTEAAIQRWGEDSTVLSIAVPLSPQRRHRLIGSEPSSTDYCPRVRPATQ